MLRMEHCLRRVDYNKQLTVKWFNRFMFYAAHGLKTTWALFPLAVSSTLIPEAFPLSLACGELFGPKVRHKDK